MIEALVLPSAMDLILGPQRPSSPVSIAAPRQLLGRPVARTQQQRWGQDRPSGRPLGLALTPPPGRTCHPQSTRPPVSLAWIHR